MNMKLEELFAPILESERLIYKIFDMNNDTHMQFAVDNLNNSMAGDSPNGVAWTKNDVRRLCYSLMMKPSDAHGRRPDTPSVYVVYLKNDLATPIGNVSFNRRTPDIPMDLGYSIRPEHRRKGYATEGAARISRYWKEEFGHKEICIITSEDNVPARKIAESIGFVDGGYVLKKGMKRVAYVLPGMKKLEGQTFPFWGDGEIPE
jgi:hypothetical protein